MKTRWQDRFTRVDVAALLVFLAVWIYYVITARYGVIFADEGVYLTIAERIVHGERPLVDEWQVAQLSCLFFCLPYKIYVALKGSTTGIILCMRYLFVAFNAVVYWFVYSRLRAYKWQGLLASALLCICVPFGIFACNYYTMSVRLMMIVCLLLFSEKQSVPTLWIAGVLLSCAVLYEPGLAFLYFGYCILVLIRFVLRKKGKRFLEDFDFCLRTRTWLHLSLSVLVCAAAFLSWLFSRSGFRNVLASVPYQLFTDPEYDFSAHGSAWSVFFRKMAEAGELYGSVCWIGAIVIVALSIAYACGLFRKYRETVRKVLFVLACALWILGCVMTFRVAKADVADLFLIVYPAPLFWFGFVCFLLCEHKNKRFLFFWVVGLGLSLCVDFLSAIALSLGSPIGFISVFVFITDLVRELRAEYDERKQQNSGDADKKRAAYGKLALRVCAGLTGCCFALWSAFILFYLQNPSVTVHLISAVPLTRETVPCKDGPCRSLRYPAEYEKNYSDKLSDVDTIRSKKPKNLFICTLAPEMYLYAELPYATFSSYTFGKTRFLNRELLYWKQHPEKLPACIFIPFDRCSPSDGEKNAWLSWVRKSFDPLCTYTLETGKSGYILYVSHWNPLPEKALPTD